MGIQEQQAQQAAPMSQGQPQGQPQGQAMATPQGIPETEQGTALYNEAVVFLYDKHLEDMLASLKQANEKTIAPILSNIVNSTLRKLEQDSGQPFPIELAAEVGFRLLVTLVEDLIADKHIPKLPRKVILGTVADIINDYALTHKETVSPEQLQEFLSTLAGKPVQLQGQGQQGQPAPQQGQPAPQQGQPAPQQPPAQGLLQ